jgi:hypothetical protein
MFLFCTMPQRLRIVRNQVSPLLREMRPIILVPIALLLFASAVYDRVSRGRIHPASLWGAVIIFI